MNGGVYCIINKINAKMYIGSAINTDKRWREHLYFLERTQHPNRKLQNSWNKYGDNNFLFFVVEKVSDKNNLIPREQYWIDNLMAFKNGFNECPNAGSSLGRVFSEKTKEKMSISRKSWHTLNPCSDETRVRHSIAHKNISDETRKRMSESQKGLHAGNKNPMFGRKHTPETQAKITAKLIGKKRTPEIIEKTASKNRGKKQSPEFIAKRIAASITSKKRIRNLRGTA